MPRRSPDERLEQMLAEARAERAPLPQLDTVSSQAVRMQAVRARLLAEFEAVARQGGVVQIRRTAPRWIGSLAVAAAVSLGLGSWWLQGGLEGPAEHAEHSAPVPTGATWMDGNSLARGGAVVAVDRQLFVEHVDRARWTLAPGSRARVLSVEADVLRIALDQGSLEAVVSPSTRPESFVVQALGTEISVHGTRFAVSLGTEARVVVTVSEGEVRVRPTGEQSGVPLRAGMSAEFMAGSLLGGAAGASASLHAERLGAAALAHDSSRSAPHKAAAPEAASRAAAPPGGLAGVAPEPRDALQPAESLRNPSEESAASVGSDAPGSAQGAPPASVERALTLATEHIQACFQKHTSGEGELTIEVSTRLIVEVEPSGAILEVRINPPLAPLVDACVARDLAALNLGGSEGGFQVDREIRLHR